MRGGHRLREAAADLGAQRAVAPRHDDVHVGERPDEGRQGVDEAIDALLPLVTRRKPDHGCAGWEPEPLANRGSPRLVATSQRCAVAAPRDHIDQRAVDVEQRRHLIRDVGAQCVEARHDLGACGVDQPGAAKGVWRLARRRSLRRAVVHVHQARADHGARDRRCEPSGHIGVEQRGVDQVGPCGACDVDERSQQARGRHGTEFVQRGSGVAERAREARSVAEGDDVHVVTLGPHGRHGRERTFGAAAAAEPGDDVQQPHAATSAAPRRSRCGAGPTVGCSANGISSSYTMGRCCSGSIRGDARGCGRTPYWQ